MFVVKRDGSKEEFNADKISNALTKAFAACGYQDVDVNQLIAEMSFWDGITIEEIQDEIEEILMDYDYKDVSKQYIIYRYQHALQREAQMLTQTNQFLNGEDNFLMKENANKRAELTNVQFSYLGGLMSQFYCDKVVFPKYLLESHNKAAIHIHDKDMRALPAITNCSLLNLYSTLYEEDENGICTVLNDVGIRKQTKFLQACTVATQIIQGVAGLQFGGMTITLSHLVPALKTEADKLKKDYPNTWNDHYVKTIRDGVQTLLYQVNSLYTTQGQFGCTIQ